MNHFPRPQLARALADNLEGKVVFGDGSNGLFLTSPRRTGKSTFLQNDLRPELQSRTITVVYVDLWENSKANPADLITEAIAKELTHQVGIFSRAKKRTHIESISIGNWLKLDTSKVSQKVSMSLADALKGLRELANPCMVISPCTSNLLIISIQAFWYARMYHGANVRIIDTKTECRSTHDKVQFTSAPGLHNVISTFVASPTV